MSDILADLYRIYQEISATPRPEAIWFIDRFWQHRQLLRLFPMERMPCSTTSRYNPMFQGMPIYLWRSTEIRDRISLILNQGYSIEYARTLFPLCQPGIWIEMSDGHHRQLDREETQKFYMAMFTLPKFEWKP